VKIVHLSDIHFGREIVPIVDAFVLRLSELNPDLVVISGDFTMAGRHTEYADALAFLGRIHQPIIATPGNHDIPVFNLPERFFAPLKRYNTYIAPASADRFVSDDGAVIALNSARPWDLSLDWSHGRISDGQIADADAFFTRHPGRRFSALVVHHPFVVPDDLPGFRTIRNGDRMLETLAKHRVDAILTGHLHRQFTTSRSIPLTEGRHEITLFQVATVASSRHRNQPNAFAVINADEHGVTSHPEVWNGESFEPTETPAAVPV